MPELNISPVAGKIALLIPRLASSFDGEVIATVRAIERTLKSGGFDLHDLSAAVSRGPVVIYHEPRPTATEPGTWGELARWCRDNDRGQLNKRERDFIRDMAARLVLRGEPTERQGDWLRAIYAKLGGGQA